MRRAKIQSTDPISEDEGVKIHCRVLKNRSANGKNPFTQCDYYARYGEGVDNFVTFPQLLIDADIITGGSWIKYINKNGDELKWNGKNKFLQALKDDETLYKELQSVLNDKMNNGEIEVEAIPNEELKEIQQLEGKDEFIEEGEDK
jgi:hypothetical protein